MMDKLGFIVSKIAISVGAGYSQCQGCLSSYFLRYKLSQVV